MERRWRSPAFEAIAELLRAETGLALPPTSLEPTEDAIGRVMADAGLTDPFAYLELLRTRARPLDELIEQLVVGETFFFRSPAQLDLIRELVLPERLAHRDAGVPLKIWSAGCATGEEAYSLAIELDGLGLLERTQLLGTDISRASLARAREAAYRDWAVRETDAAVLRQHFHRVDERWVLDSRIARQVRFEHFNLARDPSPSPVLGLWQLDLILCRNVLIYFDRATVSGVARRLHDTLAPGGWLITGPSDPPLGGAAPFETVETPAGLVYRRSPSAPRASTSRAPPPARRLIVPTAPRPTCLEPGPAVAKDEGDALGRCRLIRALADRGASEAGLLEAQQALRRAPLSIELRFLQALLLLELGRADAAERALAQVLYLDRSLAFVHYLRGSLLVRCDDVDGARRAYERARALAAELPPDEPLPFSDGASAARLLEATSAELARLDSNPVAHR